MVGSQASISAQVVREDPFDNHGGAECCTARLVADNSRFDRLALGWRA
jgi:hypothetical protein